MTRTCAVIAAGAMLLSSAGVAAQNPPAGQAPGPAAARGPAAPTPASCGPNAALKNVARDSRCFEIRTYVVQPQGPGDLDLLHRRFREQTVNFFKKHGMTMIGFWQPVDKADTLVYLLAYKDAAARDASWVAFQADPEWQKARAAMNVSIQVTSEFLAATDYSPLK